MPNLMYLVLAYGLTFGIQNKATFLRGKLAVLDRLVKCTYCTGFHSGWMTWLLAWALEGRAPATQPLGIAASVVAWGLASAAFSYGVDTAIRWLEYRPKA
jgi:hypothetical protein